MTYTVTIPTLAYMGQDVPITFSGTQTGLLYKYVYAYPASGWSYEIPLTPAGTGLLPQPATGWVSIGDMSYDPATSTLLTNNYTGQFLTLDPDQVRGLFENHQERFTYTHFESDVSSRASATEWRNSITSWEEFAAYVENQFLATTPPPGQSIDQARALFYAQWVSGLWAYGNLLDLNRPGAVTDNEVTGQIPSDEVTVRTYLDAPIGCCTDYGFVLGYLLTAAGIENNVVGDLSHVLNEVTIDGLTWTLDPTVGMAFLASYDDVVDTSKTVDVYRFDHAGMDPNSSIYRDSLTDFSIAHLLKLEIGYSLYPSVYDFYTSLHGYDYTGDMVSALPDIGIGGYNFSWSSTLPVPAYTITGDFNGDGQDDVLTDHNGGAGVDVYLSSGSGLNASTAWSSTVDALTGDWFAADINGDGRDDLVRGVGATLLAALSEAGDTFAAPATVLSVDSGAWGWWAGDFNGDGRTDVMRLVPGQSGADMYLGSASGFVSAGSWTGAGSGNQRWYVGDFNGDGRSDLARYLATGTQVFLSSGSGFTSTGTWTTQDQGTDGRWYIGDFNGDGQADLGRVTDGAGFEYLASTGTGFAEPAQLSASANARSLILGLGDFNSDGYTDLFGTNPTLAELYFRSLSPTPAFNGLDLSSVDYLIANVMARLATSRVSAELSKEAAAQDWRISQLNSFEELWMTIDARHRADVTAGTGFNFTTGADRAFNFAQWVAGMWTPGDGIGNATDQSVLDNTITGALTLSQINPRTYITSPYGSEADAASLLAALYTREGLQNAVVSAGQHVINEVYVDGGWWSIDATLGVALQGRWGDIISTGSTPQTFIFGMASTLGGSATYSADVGVRIQTFLSEVAAGLLYDFTRHEVQDWLAARPDAGMLLTFAALPFTSTRTAGWNGELFGNAMQFSVDLNGDGALDLFSYTMTSTQVDVRLAGHTDLANPSGQTGLTEPAVWLNASSGANGWYFGDFNGDQKTDIFSLLWGVSGAYTYLSTGTGFEAPTSWTGAGPGNNPWYVGDFNGDGKDDLLSYWVGVSGGLVFLSDGTQFNQTYSWTGAGNGSYGRWFIGDFNGDGKDDLGRFLEGTGFQVTLSTGASFGGIYTWSAAVTNPGTIEIADMNGDGRADLVSRGQNADEYLFYRSTGTEFQLTDWSALNDETVLAGTDGAADTFIFTGGDATIQHFDLGTSHDVMHIPTALAADFASVQAGAEQIGNDVTLHFAWDYSLTLKDVLLTSLTAEHFVFV